MLGESGRQTPYYEARTRGRGDIWSSRSLAWSLRPLVGTTQAEAAQMSLQQPPLILGYEGVESTRSASPLGTDGDGSGASQQAAERTGMESVNAPFADGETL